MKTAGQVFARLQRVRNYLAANCHLEVDNDRLARMASYSPWHFIRAFRAAYEQTPHAYLVDQRTRRGCRRRHYVSFYIPACSNGRYQGLIQPVNRLTQI